MKLGFLSFRSKSHFETMRAKRAAFIEDCLFNVHCLKITEKVSFNIASEESYVYILSGQKLIKNAQNVPVWRVLEKLKLAVE